MQVTANSLRRTLLIANTDRTGIGTAFTVDRDGRQYIVTAHHVVRGIADGETIAVRRNRMWGEYHVRVVGLDEAADVAVLAHDEPLTPPELSLDLLTEGYFVSQPVRFLGFPFGWDSGQERLNNGFPIPFVKGGIISAFIDESIFVDAHGNKGFSGGPLIVAPQPGSTTPGVIGVVIAAIDDPITSGQAGLVRATGIARVVSLIHENA